jgi:hypothetical protein
MHWEKSELPTSLIRMRKDGVNVTTSSTSWTCENNWPFYTGCWFEEPSSTGSQASSHKASCVASTRSRFVKRASSRFQVGSLTLSLSSWRHFSVPCANEHFSVLCANRTGLHSYTGPRPATQTRPVRGRCKVPQCFHHTVFPSLFGEHSKTGKTRFSVCPIAKSRLISSKYCWETLGYGKHKRYTGSGRLEPVCIAFTRGPVYLNSRRSGSHRHRVNTVIFDENSCLHGYNFQATRNGWR